MSTKLFLLLAIAVSVNGQLANYYPCISGKGLDKTAFTPKELNGKTFIEVQKYYNGAEAGYACIQQSFTADDENNGFSYERIGTTITGQTVSVASGEYSNYKSSTKTWTNDVQSHPNIGAIPSSVLYVDDKAAPKLLALYSCTASWGKYWHQLFVLSTELPVKAVEMTKLNKELAKAGFTAQGIAYLIKPNTYNCQA